MQREHSARQNPWRVGLAPAICRAFKPLIHLQAEGATGVDVGPEQGGQTTPGKYTLGCIRHLHKGGSVPTHKRGAEGI